MILDSSTRPAVLVVSRLQRNGDDPAAKASPLGEWIVSPKELELSFTSGTHCVAALMTPNTQQEVRICQLVIGGQS